MHYAQLPRRRYTTGSTAIEYLPRLTKSLGGPNVFIKRDDLLGLTAGGNKTRKLEFVMADALARQADTVITAGGVQSNHCRLTLSAARKEGLNCRLLLVEHVPGSYDANASGNNLLFKILGAEQTTVVSGDTDTMNKMAELADDATRAGGAPYIIPGGGSSPLGALGYVACAEEILAQSQELSVQFDHVICASGSGGTQAGLIAGFLGNQSEVDVTGISVSAQADLQQDKVLNLANETSKLAGGTADLPIDKVTVLDDFVGAGYTLPTAEMVEAVQLFARTEGILLDPVYTGKAAAGLISMARLGQFEPADNVLFVHTGGTPGAYAYRYPVFDE